MAQSKVGLTIAIDAVQGKSTVDGLSNSIDGLRQNIKQLEDAGDWRGAAQLYTAMNNAASARGQIINQTNQALREQNMQNTPMGGMGAWMFQHAASQITQGIISAVRTTMSSRIMRANGDYTGAAVSYERGMGELAGSAGGAVAGGILGGILSAVLHLPPMITVPICSQIASSFGQLIGGMSALTKEEALGYSQTYKKAMPAIDALNQNFGGDITSREAKDNNRIGLAMYEQGGKFAKGTGLSVEDFVAAANSMAAYGIRSETQAMNMARTDAMLARRTGADLGSLQKISGAFSRYGGEDNASAIAYGGARAQNLTNAQLPEFLQAMERILEEGIENGFARGSEEIAENLALLYKLSGNNPLWQGEQGAKRLGQMNTAIASATNLDSVEHMMTYSAFNNVLGKDEASRRAKYKEMGGDKDEYTGTYVDVMAIMERGFNKDVLKNLRDMVKGAAGENTAAEIEHYKNMFNTNYRGALQIRNIMNSKPEADWKVEIEKIQADKEYKSDSARLQDVLNDLSTNGVKIGQFTFDGTEIPLLLEATNKIYEHLAGTMEDASRDNSRGDLRDILVDQTVYTSAVDMTNHYRNRHSDDFGRGIIDEYNGITIGNQIEVGSEAELVNSRFLERLLEYGGRDPVDNEERRLLNDILHELRRSNGLNRIDPTVAPTSINLLVSPDLSADVW